MASKFLIQVVEKKTGEVVQWAPGLGLERQFEDEVCRRVGAKLGLIESRPRQVDAAPVLTPAPVVEVPVIEPKSRGFVETMKEFFGYGAAPSVDVPLVTLVVESKVDPVVETKLPAEKIMVCVREALNETFYEIKSNVRP